MVKPFSWGQGLSDTANHIITTYMTIYMVINVSHIRW